MYLFQSDAPARQDPFPPAEVYIVRRHIANRLMMAMAIVILHEPCNLPLQLHWRIVNIQVYPLLAASVISFDLAVGLRVVRTGQYVAQAVGFKVVAKVLAN